jgi:hypothetical protein
MATLKIKFNGIELNFWGLHLNKYEHITDPSHE